MVRKAAALSSAVAPTRPAAAALASASPDRRRVSAASVTVMA
jgi:hypothetical protein